MPAPFPSLLVAVLALIAAAAEAQVARVPVQPPSLGADEDWREGRGRRGACIDATRIAGAYVFDQRTLEVVMRGGSRHRLKFTRACPQLSYYGGFYYAPVTAGQLCAGRDRIMGRAGGSCTIAQIVPLERVPRRR